MKSLLIYLFLICFCPLLVAQISEIDQPLLEGNQRFKPFLSFDAGISVPLGKYNMLANKSDDRSAAGLGAYGELGLAFNPMLKSDWKTGILLGYMYNPFEKAAAQEHFDLPIIEATDWQMGYAVVGFSYRSAKRVYAGLGAYAGILAYSGGDLAVGDIDNYGMWEVYEWDYNLKTALMVKANVQLGYHITDHLGIELVGSLVYAAGVRSGTMKYAHYYMFSNQILPKPASESFRSAQNQTSVISLNIGLGLCYKFYDPPSPHDYKFNKES